MQWLDFVLAGALVGILLLLAKMRSLGLLPLRAVARVSTLYSAIEMAGTCACSSPCQNPSPVKYVIDEPAEQAPEALINSSGFRALTLNPLPLLTLVESYLQSR